MSAYEPQPDDIQVISASTAVRALEKDGLSNWKQNRLLTMAREKHHELSALLEMPQTFDHFLNESIYETPPGRLSATEAGTQVHAAMESWMHGGGTPEGTHESTWPMLHQLAAWVNSNNPQLIAAERAVFHPEHLVGGRFDLLAEVGGKRLLLDLKTSYDDKTAGGNRKRPYGDSVALQLAIYRHATHWLPADHITRTQAKWNGRIYLLGPDDIAQATPPEPIDGTAVLFCTPERCELWPVDTSEWVYNVARQAANVWRWTHVDSKRVLGKPQ